MCWPHEAATRACADALAACPALQDGFIALQGRLGAARPPFVRLLLQALGVQGRIKSPTYAVVEPYSVADPLAPGRGAFCLAFRLLPLRRSTGGEDAGFRHLRQPGSQAGRVADKAAGMLPVPDLVP